MAGCGQHGCVADLDTAHQNQHWEAGEGARPVWAPLLPSHSFMHSFITQSFPITEHLHCAGDRRHQRSDTQ